MARDYFDESKSVKKKKKKDEEKTVAKKPQSSSVSKSNVQSAQEKGKNQTKYYKSMNASQNSYAKNESRSRNNQNESQVRSNLQTQMAKKKDPLGINEANKTSNRYNRNNTKTAATSREMMDKRKQDQVDARNQKSGIMTESLKKKQEENKAKMQKTAVGRVVGNAPERWTNTQKKILAQTGVALSDIGDIANTGKANPNGRLAQDMGDLLGDREKRRKQYQQSYKELIGKRDKLEEKGEALTKGAKGLEKTYYSAEESGQGMLSDFILGQAVGGRWEIPLALRTIGGQRGKSELEGATTTEDRLNAAKDAVVEVATEKIGGFMGAGALTPGKKLLKPFADRISGNLAKRLGGTVGRDVLSGVGRLAGNALEENIEEWIANPLENFGENIIYRNRVQAEREAENDAYFNSLGNSIQQYFTENPGSVDAYVAELNSSETRDDLMKQYIDAGMTEDQANSITDRMLDFMEAAARNDTAQMKAIKASLDDVLVGDMRKKVWDWNENLESFASTSLLMLTTGLPGAVSTTMQGRAIKETEGSREAMMNALKKTIAFDPENSTKSQALLDSMEDGYEPTATQAYDIMADESKVMAEAQQRQNASDSIKANGIRRENLLAPVAVTNPDGTYDIVGEETAEKYYVDYAETLDYINEVNASEDQNKLGDNTAVAVATAVASFDAGTLNVAEISNLTEAHPEARTVFEAMTGVDLNEFNVYDRKGNIDPVKSNINMQEKLLAMSAQNYIQSARAEQEAWNDTVRGDAVTRMSSNLGGKGDVAAATALETVDPRDKNTFMLTAAAVRRVYEYSRNTTDTWNDVRHKFGSMYKGVDKEAMRSVFEAAKEDKAIAEERYYGKQVKAGEKNSLAKAKTVNVPGKFTNRSTRELKNTEISTLSEAADTLGLNVIMTDELDANENGRYNPKTRTIMLNSQNTMDDNLNAIFSHEVTHHLAAYAPEEYVKLSRLVMDRWYKADAAGYKKSVGRVQRLYKDVKGQDLSPEEALEEIIADNAIEFWTDARFAEDVCREEPSLGKAILNAIKDILSKLRSMLSSGSITDETTRQSIFDQIGIYDAAYKMYLSAYTQARQDDADQAINDWQDAVNEESQREVEARHSVGSFSISDMPSMEQLDQTNSIVNDSEGDPVAEFSEDGSVRFSISSFDEKGRKIYTDYLNKMVKTGELSRAEADEMLRELGTVYDICKTYADQTDAKGNPIFAPYTAWSYADVIYDAKGKPVFSAIKKNSEYKMNIDFSTICKKRRTLDAVFREMINQGMFEKLDFNKDESAAMVVNINDLIREYGFEAACALCFVEARRYRQQQTAKTFTDMWNGLVESLYKDKSKIAYFNFGEDSTVEDVPDGIHTMAKADLDWTHVKEVADQRNEDGKLVQTAEAKAARLLIKYPEQRKLMRVGDMMASTGFENMQIQNPKLMKVYNSKKGTGGAKSSFGDVQYLNEIIRSSTFDRRKAYAVSGVRIQSFSDYVPRMVFDYVQVIADLAAKRLPAHAYTKESLFVKQFGLSGVKINMSLVPDVAEDGIAPGLDKDGNYLWNEEGTFPYDEAMAFQEADGYKENCGTIAVGISDAQIMTMLADPTIQMVIPYHKSSLNPIVAAMTNVDRFTNYEDFQRTKGADGKALDKDFDWDNKLFELSHDKDGKELPKEQWGNVQDLVKEYADWCKENNYTPKFEQFLYARKDNKIDREILLDENGNPIINPGYYKLLEDFALLDNDGNFKPQGDVQMRFPTEESAFGSMKDLIEQGLVEDTELEAMRSEKVADIVKDINTMFEKGTLTKQTATSEKLASRFSISPEMDEAYMSAVNSGNMEEAQRLVEEAAKEAGYSVRGFHGTPFFGFTEFKDMPSEHGRVFGDGFYFTDNKEASKRFATQKWFYDKETQTQTKIGEAGIYDVFLKPDGDAFEFDWQNLTFNNHKADTAQLRKWTIQEEIEKNPDKDVIVHNINDGSQVTSTVYVIKDAGRIKSADTITYAEDGSVIPLSERFDPNNDDIRYSLATTDSEGRVLSDDQMEYFKNSQARDDQGRLVPVYHTTNRGGFTIFDPSFSDDKRSLFFASNFDVSQTYGNRADQKIPLNEKDLDLRSFIKIDGETPASFVESRMIDILDAKSGDVIYDHSDQSMLAGDALLSWYENSKEGKDTPYKVAAYDIEMSFDQFNSLMRGWIDEGYVIPRGYYEVYLNLENPLVVDARGANWNIIPYGEYNEDAVLAVRNLTVQDLGDSIYVNIWGDKKINGEWQEFRESTTIDYELVDGEVSSKAWDDVYNFMIDSGLGEDFAYANSDSFFEFNTLETFDKDGNPVESESGRYGTRDLARLAEENGHDGVIIRNVYDIGGASSLKGSNAVSDIFIAFSSEQVKDVNNTDPTENPDIRYSIVDDEEAKSRIAYEDAMDDSYEALVRYEKLIGEEDPETYNIKPFKEEDVANFYAALKADEAVVYDDPVNEEDRVRMARSKADFFSHVNAKWQDRWTTDGEVLDIKSVKKDIRNLVMGIMANSDTPARYRNEIVRKTLFDVRTAYQLMKQDQTDLASYLLYHSAQRMIDNVEFYIDDTFEQYKDLRDYFRATRISIGEEYWSDVDYNAFRKRNFGRLKLVKGATNVDEVYQELQDKYPEWFNEEENMSVPDQLLQMEHVLDTVQPYKEAYTSEAAADLAFDIADELYDIMAGGKEVRSLADTYKERYDAKTKAMKQRHAEAMLRMREAKEIGIQAERAKWQAREAKTKERTAHRKYFESIKNTYNKLKERLITNTADLHIPEQYKKELARLLAAFDLQTVGSKKRQERTGHVAQKTIKMSALRTALESIENSVEDFQINDRVTEIIDTLLGKNADMPSAVSIDGKTIDELSASELKNIDQLLKSLLHELNNFEKVKVGMKNLQAQDIANAQGNSALEHAEEFGQKYDYRNEPGLVDSILNMDEVTPAYLFRQIDPDNVGLGLMWKEIRRSQDRYIRNTKQLNEWIDEIVGKYHNKNLTKHIKGYGSDTLKEWRSVNYMREFSLESGRTIALTPAQVMSLSCLANRQQAYDHMIGAGVVVAPVSFQAKILSDKKERVNKALPAQLTDADIKNIVSTLTPEQKKVAEELQQLMATKMAAWGNEASMNVIGIELFTEKDYFPIRSDRAGLTKDLTNEQFENCIRNFGFTKAVQPGAKNAIMVDDIFDVVVEHCNNMNLYNAYTESINDFMKVFNKHFESKFDGTEYTLQQALIQAYSQKAVTYITEFIRDLNGNTSKGKQTGVENTLQTLLGNAKKASVFANVRVLLQQPTAITRAFYVIDPKYLKGISLGDIAKGTVPFNTTEAMQEMFDHCPIALWKSWGYYDINMGKNIEDIIMNEGNHLEELATSAYGKADNITWTAIWQMVKAEMKDTHPDVKEGTDEYWDLCNERMSEIVDLTQVVDSPLHRSHAMRAKGFMVKSLTSFMAEPTLTYNMVRDGFIRAREAKAKGHNRTAASIIGKTLGVFMLQAVTVSAAAALADAFRGKGGSDDDEYGALWWSNFLENLKDEMNPLNKIYYAKDIVNLAQGWDYNNLAFQGWDTMFDGFRQLNKKLYEGSETSWWTIHMNIFGGIGSLLGVPVKTLMKDGRALLELFGVELPENLVGKKKTDAVVPKNSPLQKTRLFKDKKSDGNGSASSLIKVGTENKWYDYENNPITIRDGSAFDKLLNHFGMNLTAAEKKAIANDQKEKAMYDKAEDIKAKYADLSGDEKTKKIWSDVTTYIKDEDENSKSFAELVEAGDYVSINRMKRMYLAAGGDKEYFEERVLAESKSALKKSIKYDQTDAEISAQENIIDYMLRNGITESEISEIAYKSDTAKDMKVAFRLNDKELMLESLEPLVNAGLSYEDLERLWENRNRLQIKSYKGRYKDKLKSTGSFVWPTQGTITSHFGYRDAPTAGASTDHPAIDIGAAMGSDVVAADGGTVIYVGWNGGYGNSVGIKHDNGMVTYYNHLSGYNVNEGDVVSQGQLIASVGSTGTSTGPHLDFKILDTDGNPVDPEQYLS